MRRADAIAWVVSACAVSLRLSQAKTLAALVASAVRVAERVSLANLGRRMPGNARHPIKRAYRSCNDERVEPADAMRGVLKRPVKGRKRPLLVAPDWAGVRGCRTLVAPAVPEGRSVPLCRASRAGHTYRRASEPQRRRGVAAARAPPDDPGVGGR